MRTATFALVFLLAQVVAAGAPGKSPVSDRPLYFRLALGPEPARVFSGYLDEPAGTGTGYDLAMLDLVCDGTFVAMDQAEIRLRLNPDEVEVRRQPQFELTHAGLIWSVRIDTWFTKPAARPDGRIEVGLDWDAQKDGTLAHFVNGCLRLHATASDAARAEPTRIGAPLSWKIGTRTRGPGIVVTAGLDDASGCRLRIAFGGDDEVRTRLRILTGQGEAEEVLGDFG